MATSKLYVLAVLASSIFVVLLVVGAPPGQNNVVLGTISAPGTMTITVSTDKPSYSGNSTIEVSGTMSPGGDGVTLYIRDPSGTVVIAAPVPLERGTTYDTTFETGGPGWTMSGRYTVMAAFQTEEAPVTAITSFQYTAASSSSSSSHDSLTSSRRDASIQNSGPNTNAPSNALLIGASVIALVVVTLTASAIFIVHKRNQDSVPQNERRILGIRLCSGQSIP